jgi:uncharacterized alkaline shock family protein YloU
MTDELVIKGREGSICVTPAALTRLVASATEQVDGARLRRRGLELAITDGRANATIAVRARYGVPLHELARSVQELVGTALEEMCGLEVAAVDVAVEELE